MPTRVVMVALVLYAYIVLRVGVYSMAYDADSSDWVFYVCQPLVAIPLAAWLVMGPRHWMIRISSVAFSLMLIVCLFNVTRAMIPDDPSMGSALSMMDVDLLSEFLVVVVCLCLFRLIGCRIEDPDWPRTRFVTQEWFIATAYFGGTLVLTQFFPRTELWQSTSMMWNQRLFLWKHVAVEVVPAVGCCLMVAPMFLTRKWLPWGAVAVGIVTVAYVWLMLDYLNLAAADRYQTTLSILLQQAVAVAFFVFLQRIGFRMTRSSEARTPATNGRSS